MRDINSSDIQTDLIKDIQKNLWENLNNSKFKRLQAPAQVGAADMHFYKKVFPNDVLKALESTGTVFSLWGTVITLKKRNRPNQKLYIGCGPDGFAPVGLRWCRDATEWKQTNKQTRQVDKRGNIQIWRPQIIVTMRPQHLYDKWRNDSYFTSDNDKSGGSRKFITSRIIAQPEWKDVKIVPLQVTLRITSHSSHSFPTEALQYSKGIETTEESRHHHDDEEFLKDSDFKSRLGNEEGHINGMLDYLRKINKQYNEEVGVSW
jgi:hypothetical protein